MKDIQEDRLNFLLHTFLRENTNYRASDMPTTKTEKEALLRALMNVRMPSPLSEEILTVQDAYLRACTEARGIVSLENIPVIADTLGSRTRHAEVLALWQGDITCLAVDAIVNAANAQMLGCFIPMHHCIDNCIHTYAGVQLRADCQERMRQLRVQYGADYEQPTAVPMLTDAYNLPAQKIIHIVGPIVERELTTAHEELLANCYQRTLDVCLAHGLKSVAFCCISTGVFRFPNARAAEIAVATVEDWLDTHPQTMEKVIFNVFKDKDKSYYEQYLQ